MKKSTYSILGIAIFVLMVSAPLLSSINITEVNLSIESKPTTKVTISYTEHGPIQIDNNTHFGDVAIAEGWDGDGSVYLGTRLGKIRASFISGSLPLIEGMLYELEKAGF